MVGRIVVGEPGGPAEERPIPDGDVPDSDMIVEQRVVPIGDGEGAGRATDRGMMGDGSGMRDGNRTGWMMVMPIGFMTAVLGLIGGVAYWAGKKTASERSNGDS